MAGVLEDPPGDVVPGDHVAAVGHVERARGRVRGDQVQQGVGEVVGEGEAAVLVGDDGRVDPALGEGGHGGHEVLPLPDHPGGADDPVPRHGAHRGLAGGLRLAVDAQRRERVVHRVLLPHGEGAVEHVVGRDVGQGDAGLGAAAGELGDGGRVDGPGLGPALGRLGGVHRGHGGRVDHGAQAAEVLPRPRGRIGHVPGVPAVGLDRDPRGLGAGHEGAAELAAGAEHEDRGGRHGGDVREHRVGAVLVRELGVLERDGPGDGRRRVREVEERVLALRVGGPVVVHQVRVGGVRLERLVGVAHPARHEDGLLRAELHGGDGAEGRPFAQVHPGAEDPAVGDGHVLVPRFGVDAAGGADGVVEGDVVLHRGERGEAGVLGGEGADLLPLPVLLEPAAVVPVDVEVEDEQAGDGGLGDAHQRCPLTGPGRGRWPRRRPWPGATRPRSRGTSGPCPPDRRGCP